MSLFLIIKKFIEAVVGVNKEPWKYIYPAFLAGAILIIGLWNSYIEDLNLNLLRVTIISEGVFFIILLLAGLIKKDLAYTHKFEELIFFIPLFLYNTVFVNIYLVLTFLYYLFIHFRFDKAGKTTATLFLFLNVFILSMFRFELINLKTQGFLFLVTALLVSIVQKAKSFTWSMMLMSLFYSLQFLETTPKLILGCSLTALILVFKILIAEKMIQPQKLKEISFIEEIQIKFKTYFKNEEKTLFLVSLNKEHVSKEKQIIENKIYYLNTIKQAQALSLTVAIIGLLLSLYFVGNIL